MKKTLLVLVFGLITSIVSAASVSWSIGPNVIAKDGSSLSGVAVYLIQGTSATETMEAIKANTWNATTALASATTLPIGNLETVTVTDTDGNWVVGGTYSFYMVAFDAATIADAKNFAVSNVLTATAGGSAGDGAPPTPNGAVTWTNTADATATTNGWVSMQTIPEPTVLALLALGVTGLALRRRA